jgi:hypothetical protein
MSAIPDTQLTELMQAFDIFELLYEQNGASHEKPRRRGLAKKTKLLREAVLELTGHYDRMTVRQVFYALTVAGVVPKTEQGYDSVQRQLVAMRREGELPFDFIADGTRWQRKPSTWDSKADFLEHTLRAYRRDLWQSQGVRIEVWLEKDALADIVTDVTDRWDVALMVSRGQSSLTFLHSAAQQADQAARQGVETYIYALYDYDAGGDRAARAVERDLPEFAPACVAHDALHFERLAVTSQQIAAWNLPTRPAKGKDPEAAKWGNKPCVELDAIPVDKLKGLVKDAIVQHIDGHKWEVEEVMEAEERRGLSLLAQAEG